MRRLAFLCLVISSVFAAQCALAGNRPQYGGTLHIALHEVPSSIDPTQSRNDSFAFRNITHLIFENLTTVDDAEHVLPQLATSWLSDANSQRWTFTLRSDVMFDDDTSLTADIVAASIRSANSEWRVAAERNRVVIQANIPSPNLPSVLAEAQYSIINRHSDGSLSGTGPFRIVEWQRKKLALAASENCWRGRPYLDRIEIEFGGNPHDEQLSLESGRNDLVDVPAEQVHRVSMEGQMLLSSQPIELLALLFTRDAQSDEEKASRQALAVSIERRSIRSVILQGSGELAGGILPSWMSGYGFVFPVDSNLAQARALRQQARTIPNWTISFDPSDAVARFLAERVALNARDAGLSVQPEASGKTDLRVVRIPLLNDPRMALTSVASFSGIVQPGIKSDAAGDLYAAENALLASRTIIPLFHLPVSYAYAPALKDFRLSASGAWNLADVWMETPNR